MPPTVEAPTHEAPTADAPAVVRSGRRRSRDVLVGAIVVVLATLAVGFGWVLPASTSRLDDLVGIARVGVVSLVVLVALAIVGGAVARVLPRSARRDLGMGPTLALGIVAVAVLGLGEHALTGRVVLTPFVAVGAGVVVAVVRAVVVARRHGARTLLAQTGARVGDRIASLDWVPMALAGVAMLPVARHGLTAWTLGIVDWHRYAGSAVVWMGGAEAFLETHPDTYGSTMAARAGFEKPAVTAMLVAVARWTGVHPVGLLTPLLVVLLAVLAASAAAMVRTGFATSARVALAASVPASLSIAVLVPIAHAQPGGIAATALLCAGVAIAALLSTASTAVAAIRVGTVAGVVVGIAIASNGTVAASAMPAALIVAAWLVLRWRMPMRVVGPGAAAAVVGATLVVATQAGRLLRSLSGQLDGEAGVAIPLPTPLGVLGLEPLGGVPTPIAVVAWLAAIAVVVLMAMRLRPSVDAAWIVVLVVVCVACLAGLALVYGIDGYSTGKWVGIVVPIVVPPIVAIVLGAATSRAVVDAIGERVLAGVVGGVLVVVPVAGASAFAAVQLVLPGSAVGIASSQALAEEEVVNVDLDSQHAAGLVPLLVPASVVISMDQTYATPAEPVGDVFLMDDEESVARDWIAQQALTPELMVGTVDLDADPTGVSLLAPGGADHLFGGWIDTVPERTLLTDATEPGLVVLDVADAPTAIVVSGFAEGPTRVEVTIGDETVESTPQGGVLSVRVPVDADDVVDGRLVVLVAVESTGEDGEAVARIDGIELQGVR